MVGYNLILIGENCSTRDKCVVTDILHHLQKRLGINFKAILKNEGKQVSKTLQSGSRCYNFLHQLVYY